MTKNWHAPVARLVAPTFYCVLYNCTTNDCVKDLLIATIVQHLTVLCSWAVLHL